MIVPSRRRFLMGVGAVLAAPAIVRVSSLMAVKPVAVTVSRFVFLGDSLTLHDYCHPNEEGHRQLAESIASKIAARWSAENYTPKLSWASLVPSDAPLSLGS